MSGKKGPVSDQNNSLRKILFGDVLPFVSKPARYAGHEQNAIFKIHFEGMIKVALCFPEMYEIGPEVIEAVQEAFGPDAPELLPRFGGSTHFDLWAANRLTLEQAGLRNIEVAGICTGTHTEDWFSHRAEKGKTGRFGVLMGLDEQ